jgi:Zn-finger nucleic acid-binding protein
MEGTWYNCAASSGESRLICPICGIEMIAVERSGIELDSCISCRGFWFDRGELDLLGELSGCDLSTLDLGTSTGSSVRRHCPRCRKPLEEAVYGAIRIDRCPGGDGFWFDRGELGGLIDRALTATGGIATVSQFLGEVFGARPDDGRENPRQEEPRP